VLKMPFVHRNGQAKTIGGISRWDKYFPEKLRE
jgi:hypothetical protein